MKQAAFRRTTFAGAGRPDRVALTGEPMMRRILFLAAALMAPAAPAAATPAEDFHRLMDEHYAFLLRENPTDATALGVRDYDDRIRDLSPAARDRRIEAERGFLARLEAI